MEIELEGPVLWPFSDLYFSSQTPYSDDLSSKKTVQISENSIFRLFTAFRKNAAWKETKTRVATRQSKREEPTHGSGCCH